MGGARHSAFQTLPGPPLAGPAPGPSELLPDAVRSLYAQGGVALFGNLLGAVVLAAVFAPVAPAPGLLAWGLLFAALWGLRVWTLRGYRRLDDAEAARQAPLWRRRWIGGAIGSGALWGLAGWLFYGQAVVATVGRPVALALEISTARMPARDAAATWSRMSASSGETSSVGPVPRRRSSAVETKYTADLPHPVRCTTSARCPCSTRAATATS